MATIEGPERLLRILTVRRQIQGEFYDLTLGTDLLIAGAILREFWLWTLGSLPLVLAAAFLAGYWISGRALAPVRQMISAAHSIDSSRLEQRIAVPPTRDEIQRLAETMNAMLARIESGFQQVRQFTANASHELRTPVAIIRAMAEVALLRPAGDGKSYREALQKILREAERNTKLLESILTLARADAGSDRAHRERIDARQILSQACAQAAPLAQSKGIDLELPRADEPCWIDADPDQLRRLFVILLDNAVKYTPADGRIFAAAGQAQGLVRCSVTDSGTGIAPEHVPHIFERFYRVDRARSRSGGGAGLGLSIASEIARLHGAVIGVDSAPGSGSTFHVTFPAPRAGTTAARGGLRGRPVSADFR